MATTPAAGNLDEKLEDIIRDIQFFDEIDSKKKIESIKQAFKDAGYIKDPGLEDYREYDSEGLSV